MVFDTERSKGKGDERMKKMMGLISANQENWQFGALTDVRPAASVPFCGKYRLIDFPLSNLVNSGITAVGIIVPHMHRSLADHVGAGQAWNLSRKTGGLFLMPGSLCGARNLDGKFILEDILLNQIFLERGARDLVVCCGCGKLFNMDYQGMAQYHMEAGADVTLLYKPNMTADTDAWYLELGKTERVTHISPYPTEEKRCFLDAFIINCDMLLDLLRWYRALGYMDLMDIFIENLDNFKIYAYPFHGYVGSVRNLREYMQTSMDMLDDQNRAALLSGGPVQTKTQDLPPARYMEHARVTDSLITSGSVIAGKVENSIVFCDVKIEEGAVVRNSILMAGCTVGKGARLEQVICDKNSFIHANTVLSGQENNPIVVAKGSKI